MTDRITTSIRGRTTSAPRLMGKCGFVHIFENGNFHQLFSKSDLPTWETFLSLSQGDIVECDGELFETKTGEMTIRLSELEILRRCELGLPDRVAGVGLEVSRRNKYMALLSEIVSKDRNLDYRNALILRSKLLNEIRIYLNSRGFLEVTTPTLIENPFGCDAKPFTTNGYYLRIAPELELKKLVVGGLDRIYEIGKSFRNEGLSQKHNPEFTMLELYCTGGDYKDAMKLTEKILHRCIMWSLLEFNVKGIMWKDFQTLDTQDFDEAALIQPTFVTGFSAEDSPLAKIGADGIAERFELYAGGMELANGYSEQDDWRAQQAVFERQGVVDEDYINALKAGLPPTFGIGIGIDRLIMLLTGRNIKEVI
jgi:lysyl-tRNA synthetase class 2